jgi:hydroxymethylpyrimidine pyrophosphatase-like HAD family hydrolase
LKFSVLALDYDGTIAKDGVLDPAVREAIGELRAKGIVVLIVTGRILDELRRVAGDLHFVDGIVAENGAVIDFPASGYSAVVANPAPQNFLEELRRRGISFAAGQVIVDTDAGEAPRVLEILRRLELPLVMVFNRGRLMVLPQTISKATGIREALKILRLSPHNVVAIGDAENDHELLQACEVGVAVGWGSEALKASADYVLPGQGPAAVAGYIRDLGNQRRIPRQLETRRHLLLGHTDDGQPLTLAVRGRNVLIAGDSKSGKSWIAGLLCEQLILYGYCLCIIDPEGDYTSLEALPGVIVFGGADPLPRPRDLLRALRHPEGSIVIDLSHTPREEKLDYVRTLLPSLAKLRRLTGVPHRIIVDEAHYFLHDANVPDLLDMEPNGYTLVSYRPSELRGDVLAASEAIVVTRESDPQEVRALLALCPSCDSKNEQTWEELFGKLVVGEAVVLPITEEVGGQLRKIRLAPRLTPHVRHFAKYIDIPVTAGRAFVFWGNGSPTGRRAQTLREFLAIIEQEKASMLDGHLRRHDFSHWIAEVFGDYPLAKTMRSLEDKHRAGKLTDVVARVSEAVRSRYEFIDPHAKYGDA